MMETEMGNRLRLDMDIGRYGSTGLFLKKSDLIVISLVFTV